MSSPIVLIVCMDSSSRTWEPLAAPESVALACRWRSRPQHHQRTVGRSPPFGKQCSRARQDYLDFREFTWLRIDFDRATMLLDDDVMSDGEPKSGTLARRRGGVLSRRFVVVSLGPRTSAVSHLQTWRRFGAR